MTRMARGGPLIAASIFALLAGFVDGFGFRYLGGFFVSFMSGNTTRGSVEMVSGHAAAAGFALALIVGFVVGVVLGALAGRPTRTMALLLTALALALAAAYAGLQPVVGVFLALAMGSMNMVFAKAGRASFGVTYMTGALVKFGEGLVAAARGTDRTSWVRPIVMWASIAVGAVLGASIYVVLGISALWIVIAALLVVVLVPTTRSWLGAPAS